MKKEHSPHSRGFDKVFSFLAGSGNHYNYEPQLTDPRYNLPWTGKLWMEDDIYIDRAKDIPGNFYSTTYTTERMLDFLRNRTDEQKEKPFFGYLAYLAPHWPLQAPKEKWQTYKGLYNDGPLKLSERRVQRLIELGLVPADVAPAKPEGWGIEKDWEALTDQEKAESARKMEVYAGMVEMIDDGIGEIIAYLESTGELDNTFILFMSDNGAEGVMMEALHVMGDETTMADIVNMYYDNSLENIGASNSFVWYGPGWASAATAPSRGWKAWPTEGGIRCPCIIRYPGFYQKPESITHSFTTVMDILPTILELAEVPHPGQIFRGREVVAVRGKSWVPHLTSRDLESTSVHNETEHIHGWELFGLRAIRKGPWKAVWMHPPRGSSRGNYTIWMRIQVSKLIRRPMKRRN
jgi:arylsulfatase A-like enzyme